VKQLPKRWVRRLITEPETGMGYQEVTFILKNRKKVDATVSDCEHVLHSQQEFNFEDIENVRIKDKQGNYI